MKKSIVVFLFICFTVYPLFSYEGTWQQFFDLPVIDMESSQITGIHFEGFVFIVPGIDGGLAYYTSPDSLHVFSTNLPSFISVAPDDNNDRIFCATGGDSYSDGLYVFDVVSEQFENVLYFPGGNFVKKLPSGFYFGWGDDSLGEGGLFHSTDGEQWNAITFFDDKNIIDIEETGEGIIFVAATDGLYIIDNGRTSSFSTHRNMSGNLYVRQYPYDDEVYLAVGVGSYSDGIYQVEYEDGEITDLVVLNWVFMAHTIYEYNGYFIVGCKNNTSTSNLFLVEPVQFGEIHQIGSELGIDEIHCFDYLSSINCPNILVGSDAGLFLGTGLLTETDDVVITKPEIAISNYPNPFNPETTIRLELPEKGEVELTIYNIRGQKVKKLIDAHLPPGIFESSWNGRDDNGRPVASGQYFIKLKHKGEVMVEKMMLIK